MYKPKFPRRREKPTQTKKTFAYQIPLPLRDKANNNKVVQLLPFKEILSRPSAQKICGYLFSNVIIGVLVLSMITPEIKTLIVLGDLLLGYMLFFPIEKTYKAFGVYITALPARDQMTYKIAACLLVITILSNFWNPLVNYFYNQDTPRDVRNLVINTSSYYRKADGMKGLLVEFGVQWDDVDPVIVTVNIENASDNNSDAWWYTPGYKINEFETDKILKYDQTSDKGFFSGQKLINPPSFGYYSIGTPLTSTNSLYLWFWSPENMSIEEIIFQGKHYHVTSGRAILDKR